MRLSTTAAKNKKKVIKRKLAINIEIKRVPVGVIISQKPKAKNFNYGDIPEKQIRSILGLTQVHYMIVPLVVRL